MRSTLLRTQSAARRYPQLWGTRRIGPDLSRENGLRTEDRQYAHLYNPRSTVPDSIMPGYSWMFSGNAAQPNVDARDLVAYVRSFGRERSLAGESGGEQVDHGTAMEMSSSYGAQGVPDTRTRSTVIGLDASAPIFSFAQSSDAVRPTHGREICPAVEITNRLPSRLVRLADSTLGIVLLVRSRGSEVRPVPSALRMQAIPGLSRQ
jgi:hypothetical protein